ncbi:unnamed protein product [Candidula unifasciata]|uniref:Uncharacterized protein n=1 Tax=Candidula unifasciata TaxID=100452 RepID=A0A8S4A0Q0_9EUPU|nr:unnamed protein product [Candidula unifasciata]
MRLHGLTPGHTVALLVAFFSAISLHQGALGFKYHEFCATPPNEMKTRFPLYRLEVDTKIDGIPWAYRQNNTLTVSVKALYETFKIKQIFISVPSMTKGTAEILPKKIHLGEWKWDMKGGVIPIDCSNPTGGFGGASNAVRNLWWFSNGFFNVTGEWDPLNTISNAYNVDMVQFEAYVSPDEEPSTNAGGTVGPAPAPVRWVKLTSDKYINLDYIDLHRYMRMVFGPADFHGLNLQQTFDTSEV